MDVLVTTDPAEFTDRVVGFLARKPVRNTVILSNLAARTSGAIVDAGSSYYLSVHDDDGQVVGAAMQTHGHGAVVGSVADEHIVPVAAALAEVTNDVTVVDGTKTGALAFARYWGTPFHLTHETRLYELGDLIPASAPGHARPARPDEVELCEEWARATLVEIGDAVPAEFHMQRRVADGRMWLWEDEGRPVSLAGTSVPAAGVTRIGPVYTPVGDRGRGYASALTSHVSDVLRDDTAVCLFTDIANRTSNKIYAAIGFRPVADFARYALTVPA